MTQQRRDCSCLDRHGLATAWVGPAGRRGGGGPLCLRAQRGHPSRISCERLLRPEEARGRPGSAVGVGRLAYWPTGRSAQPAGARGSATRGGRVLAALRLECAASRQCPAPLASLAPGRGAMRAHPPPAPRTRVPSDGAFRLT